MKKQAAFLLLIFIQIGFSYGQHLNHRRAEMLFLSGRYDLAAQEYKKILESDPKNDYAPLKLTQCYLETGDLKLAKNYFSIAEKVSSMKPPTRRPCPDQAFTGREDKGREGPRLNVLEDLRERGRPDPRIGQGRGRPRTITS